MRSKAGILVIVLLLVALGSAAYFFLTPGEPEVAELRDESFPGAPDPKAVDAAALMDRADALAEKDQIDEAIALYQKVIRENPDTEDPGNEFGDGRFSTRARQEIAFLECRRQAPRDPAFDSPDALLAAVEKAFESKDPKKVAALAVCDFAVGPPQSDTGVSVNPFEVAGTMLELLTDASWSGARVDLPFRAIVVKSSEGTEFRLGLTEAELGGKWGWSAFTTMSEKALNTLAEAAGYR